MITHTHIPGGNAMSGTNGPFRERSHFPQVEDEVFSLFPLTKYAECGWFWTAREVHYEAAWVCPV